MMVEDDDEAVVHVGLMNFVTVVERIGLPVAGY